MSLPAAVLLALPLGGLAPSAAQDAGETPPGWHVLFRVPEGATSFASENGAVFGQALSFGPDGIQDRVPLAALALPAGATPDPRVGANWWATYTTRVEIEDAGRYRFFVEVGDARALLAVSTAGGDPLGGNGEWIELEPGELALTVELRPLGGTPRLRTMWEREEDERGGFRPEPIPTRVTRVPPEAAAALAASESAFRGRVLLERKGCTNCHLPPANGVHVVGRRSAPRLDGLGSRASAAWVDLWLRDPARVRPGADMPRLLPANEGGRELGEALVHFLAALKDAGDAGDDGGVASEDEPLRLGRELYHRVGCVACHGALEPPAAVFGNELLPDELPAARPPAPFGDLRGKWRPSALAAFLRDPVAVYPDGRMPAAALGEQESDLVATYLLRRWGGDWTAFPADPDLSGYGRQAFIMLACAACHPIEAGEGLAQAHAQEAPLDRLDPWRGCLDPNDESTPRYDLTDAERADLRAGIESVVGASGRPAPLDAARRTVALAGCASCHVVGGEGGPDEALRDYFVSTADEVDLGDEGRLAPDLDEPGTKLTTHWLRELLLGERRARPYLATRMPRYGEALVGELPEELARREGVLPDTDAEEPVATDEAVRSGRELMPRTALGCVACHVYKDWPPAGTPGPAITDFAERLRYEWYAGYVATPQRTKPGSRMPSFGRGGKSTLAGVLDGDLHAQADAMWCYFTLGDGMLPPEGVEPSTRMKLVVGERPIVQRTFLEGAGSRAIAVGGPDGSHYAFDAAAVRLALAWRGEFLDVGGIWAGRGGTALEPQGDVFWTALPGPPFLIGGEDEPAVWPTGTGAEAGFSFRGYRLGDDGWPTFLYDVGGVRVEERVWTQGATAPFLRRAFLLRGLAPGTPVWFLFEPGDVVLGPSWNVHAPYGVEGVRAFRADEDGTLDLTVRKKP